MKISPIAFLALSAIGGASGFTHSSSRIASTSLRMSDLAEPITEEPQEALVEDPINSLPKMSESMPFLTRPAALTGELAGDVGFDPLGFAKTRNDLMNFREAEVKHARLAMLAAAGWPLSEIFDKKIASALGMTPILDASDRAPSLLNGGLGKISPLYWIGCIGLAAAIDLYGISKAKSANENSGYFPGNLGFDPLGLYPNDVEGQQRMQLAEIKNGRLAMIAVTGFAMQEAVYKLGVVDKTPLFFLPLSETLHQYTNAGYIM